MEKSASAFRTISEVADFLETPAHVLRFWESRFPQIKPVKRAGGRRYYRPGDVALLAGIKRLLHDEGMTIRGVQKILREQGVRHVSGMTETEVEAAEALHAAFEKDVVADKPEAQVVSLSDWVGAAETPPPTAAATSEPVPPPAAAPPATKVEPVTTDDEVVEEAAFRSALDWAKSLSPTEGSAAAPTNAILQLTEMIAIEEVLAADIDDAPYEAVATETHADITEDLDEDDRDDDALHLDAAAEARTADPFTTVVNQARQTNPALTPPASDSPPAMDESPIAKPDLTAEDGAASVWLPTHLRRRTAVDLAPHTAALRPLHARLTALHARVAEAARSSRT